MDLAQHCARLTGEPYAALEADSAARRVAWAQKRYGAELASLPRTPRRAYELFLGEYLGLRPEQVPIVRETPTEIEWLSLNPCPTLEACQQLGLDTRLVCRAIYERPVQALLSQLDPQLRFTRSYTEIRPYAPHCRERIVRLDFAALLRQAHEAAGADGVGAIVVLDTSPVARASGPHAAAGAIRQAQALGDGNLCGGILFATRRPCQACTALAARANLTTIVYDAGCEENARSGHTTGMDAAEQPWALPEVIGWVQERNH